MKLPDWAVLAALTAWLIAALAALRRKKPCTGDCRRCGKCSR